MAGSSLVLATAPVLPAAGTQCADRTVQCLDPVRESDWDVSLARNPKGSFFQSAAWSAVLQESYGYTAHYLARREGSEITELLPLMEVDSWLTGRRGISLPFTDESAPVCADEQRFKILFERAMALGKERGWKYLELRGGQQFFAGVNPSLAFYSHRMPLGPDEAKLFGSVAGSVRQGIRKAEKSGVTVEANDTLESMKDFYALFCQTRKKHGMPPQPFRFFERIHAHVLSKNLGRVFLARFEGRPVAGAVHFNFGRSAIYKFGASDERWQHLRANNLVMWEAVKHHARNGLTALDLGRTSLGNEGLRRFKLNWGTAEKTINYFKYDLKMNCFLKGTDRASGWHNAVFARAPIFISRAAGAFLYPHWA